MAIDKKPSAISTAAPIACCAHAAESMGQMRTEFFLASAREQAADVLLDQTLFMLNEADWNVFQHALDKPAAANSKLRALLARKAVWEK
jgi:uncharacterized protein (DUF1778 family)